LNAWTQSVADPCRTRYSAGEDVDLVESTFEGGYYPGEVYFGYRTPMGKGIWASHQRILYWAHGRFILTLDNIRRERLAEPELEADLPSLECNWQFSEGGNGLKLDPDAARALTTYPESNLLMLMPLLPNGIKWTVYEGQQDPPRGWVAGPCFEGITIPAPQLNLRLPAMKGIFGEFAAVLIPFAGVKPPEVKAQARPAIPDEIFWKGAKSIGEVNLLWGNGSTDAVHWSYRLDQTLDQAINGIETDGAMLHLHRDPAGVIQYGYAMDATYVLPYQPKPRSKPGAIKFKATP